MAVCHRVQAYAYVECLDDEVWETLRGVSVELKWTNPRLNAIYGSWGLLGGPRRCAKDELLHDLKKMGQTDTAKVSMDS